MKKIIFVISIIILSLASQAQKVWTLDECVDYAMEHNVQILQTILSQDNAEYQYKKSKNAWLPTVSADASQNFGFGQSPSSNGVYVSDNSASTSFGISVGMPLFNGLNLYNQTKSSALAMEASKKDLEAAKFDLKLLIMSYYMQVVYNKEIKAVAEKQLALTQEQHSKTQQLYELGKVAESNLYESAAQVSTARSTLVQAENNLMLSILDIVQALELESVEGFDVVSPDTFSGQEAPTIPSQDMTYEHAVQNQPKMQAANLRLEQTHFDVKAIKSSWYPSLSLYAGYSNGYYKYFTDGYPNASFSDQMSTNGRTSVGLRLSIPIFNAMQTKYNVEISKLSIQNQELAITNAQKDLKKEIQQAYYNAVAAKQKYIAADETYQSADVAYRYSNESYEAGKATLLELNESKNRLFKSESEMLQAKYEYIYRIKVLNYYNQ
ncbi:MAG: TolC family protein [Bacteroidales bacterium]|nr:TolC family protein [Bacteroidales bacterium]